MTLHYFFFPSADTVHFSQTLTKGSTTPRCPLNSLDRLPNQEMLPIWQYFAYLGNINLSNCFEFDNLTLNCSVGTKLSKAGYFPFAHYIIITHFDNFHRVVKNIERLRFLTVFLILFF